MSNLINRLQLVYATGQCPLRDVAFQLVSEALELPIGAPSTADKDPLDRRILGSLAHIHNV
ncbi:MAG TPA: hypothetical protein PLL45_01325, partial [Thermoflexales bacterium]|nr:hypothetical protein [Thermoflexales bacterium]